MIVATSTKASQLPKTLFALAVYMPRRALKMASSDSRRYEHFTCGPIGLGTLNLAANATSVQSSATNWDAAVIVLRAVVPLLSGWVGWGHIPSI
jgi:hypothetical protein